MAVADLLTLDGSAGEGGGQILRSSLALSMATGRPFRIVRIRANRKKPGLMRQHLTSVLAAARVSNAHLEGAELESQELVFRPGPVLPGIYEFPVGTAGSTSLVFQTVFPALLLTGKPFTLTLEGGTHNSGAPNLDFIEKVYLRALEPMGVKSDVKVTRRGFYPAGGGRWTVSVAPPEKLGRLEILDRGPLKSLDVRILWARIPAHVGQREADHVKSGLGLREYQVRIEEARDSLGPGNVILAEIRHDQVTEMVTGFGARGIRSEAVAQMVVEEVREYLEGKAPVGPHLADQLMLPMVLGGGGVFRTLPLTLHSRTNIETIGRFLARPIQVENLPDGLAEIRIL